MTDQDIFEAYKKAETYKTLYKQKVKFFIEPEFNETNFDELMLSTSTYKESVVKIKEFFTKEGLARYRAQFKRFKYNFTNNIVTLKLRQETHDKITRLASDFGGLDDYLFEYFFDPAYRVDGQKILDIPSALSAEEQLDLLMRVMPYQAIKIIEAGLKTAHKEGFVLGQKTKKIRSKKGLDAAILELDYEHEIF